MTHDHIQAMLDKQIAEWQRERAESQMTLGKLVKRLKEMSPETLIQSFGFPHSYRGYYQDLAFELNVGTMTVTQALEMCYECLGEKFQGYKGGEYAMIRDTPIWIANYGHCGKKIMAIRDDGMLELVKDDY